MKRAALYVRVSTVDQHPETQLHELRTFAAQRGLQIVGEYTDHGFSGTRARRPDIDRQQVVHDRRSGMSLTQVACKHSISRASVCRLVKEASEIPHSSPSMTTGELA